MLSSLNLALTGSGSSVQKELARMTVVAGSCNDKAFNTRHVIISGTDHVICKINPSLMEVLGAI